MTKDSELIVSMTTWPPRAQNAVAAMRSIVSQEHTVPVRFLLTLSCEEWTDGAPSLEDNMLLMGVEVIYDEGNTMSHKKLMPVLERHPDATVIVVDDDFNQREGWLQTFIDDHQAHPQDIIYGHSSSVVEMLPNGEIVESVRQRGFHTHPGSVTANEKPANGVSGTLYPAGIFSDPEFFDRKLYMELSPTSDETWQWAWAVMQRKTFRCLSSHNTPRYNGADQHCALFMKNVFRYNYYHNMIAERYPEYREALREIIENKNKKL